MPIISKVEAKSLRGKFLYAVMFIFLSTIGLTLIYPFALTISGSMRTPMDQPEMNLIPKYLVDRDVLYRKFLETKYNQDIAKANIAREEANFTFRTTAPPAPLVPQQADDLVAFANDVKLPFHWQILGGIWATGKMSPEPLRELMDRLRERYHGDLAAFGRDAGTPITGWTRLFITVPDWLSQRYDYQPGPQFEVYCQLLDDTDLAYRQIISVSGYFLDQVAFPAFGKTNLAAFNKAHPQGPTLNSWSEFVLPQTVPPASNAKFRKEWIDFATKSIHPSFITVPDSNRNAFESALTTKYGNDIAALNKAWNATYASFSEIPMPSGTQWLRGAQAQDFREFVLKQPPETWKLAGPEYAWREWLTQKYKTVDALNAAHQTKVASFDAARLPAEQLEYRYVGYHAGRLRWDYATRNYAVVLRELISQGRPFWNTLIVCGFSVVLTLLINPIAAYAMSRYRLPGTYKILLLLMVTAAFPPMVVLVPQFLLLREGGLLNSYMALIVPFVASGYLIFLLKGFFDSLPHNLYEAALIDGCGEIRMFFTITMSLSKPILAVVALQAFSSAYTMFLYPLVVCPRSDMWTLNVWLYQWQSTATQSGIFASLLIAAVPTLLIFLFAQNVIMRGIVVPVEK